MKGKALLMILLLLGGYLYLNGYIKIPDNLSPDNNPYPPGEGSGSGGFSTGEVAQGLRGTVIEMGASDAYVSLSGERTLVQFEAPAVNEALMGMAYEVAKKAYEANPAKEVRVEAYYLGEPVLGLTINNGNFDNPEFEDIRRPEFKVESDLWLFDVLVHNVTVTNETASVTLEYLADGEGFWKDYFAMSFLILEDAPWVEEVSITYLADNGSLTLSTSSDDILRLHSGEITADELPNIVHISAENAGGSVEPGATCAPSKEEAYRLFVQAYNNVTSLQASGASDEEIQEAYAKYQKARACYESFLTTTTSAAPIGEMGEIKSATLDTEGTMVMKFSTGELWNSDQLSQLTGEGYDLMAEPWCVEYPALLGHWIDLGEGSLDTLDPRVVPASGYPVGEVSGEIEMGHVYVNRNADGTLTAFELVSHEKTGDCSHRITIRYANLGGG
ncbi:hypothetical protein APY94_09360 [Thermococcus celericrescens]|uniref:Uncharacterized protein n=1 Tax=Thermococcus celericrescens TaxID=227598 RepID=A0A117IT60_9EURY|nr:hypothetical protein [Thermococcus celericrescens]KUH32571.1 hypothetical protein APY94_09360 [Thermococcus celericrescens]